MDRWDRHLLITGGTGYIGTALVKLAIAQGCTVTVLSRTQPAGLPNPRVRYVPYALTEPFPPEAFLDVHAVVHLAADTTSGANRLPEQVEVDAAHRLFAAASARGCRFLFVSSQSAREDAPTAYGRIKWRIEQTVLQGGGSVVRPGLVYGGDRAAGIFGTLVGLVQRWPVLPDLIPQPMVQPVHLSDLCLALLRMACDPRVRPGAYNLGAPETVSFTDFLKAIARYRVRQPRLFLPVPARLLIALARGQKICPLFPDQGGERLLGLAALQPMATQESLRQLGIEPCLLSAGMQRGAAADSRRSLAWEGYALLSYVTGRRSSLALVKRYVGGVSLRHDATPLPVPLLFLRWPRLLRLLDTNRRLLDLYGCRQLSDRLALAVALAEASPAGAEQFLQLQPRSAMNAWLSLVGLVLEEIAVQSLQWGYATLARLGARRKTEHRGTAQR